MHLSSVYTNLKKRVRPWFAGLALLNLALALAGRLLCRLDRVPLAVIDVKRPGPKGTEPEAHPGERELQHAQLLSPHERSVEEELDRAEVDAVADPARGDVEGLHGGQRKVRPAEPGSVEVRGDLLRAGRVHQPPLTVELLAVDPSIALLRFLHRRDGGVEVVDIGAAVSRGGVKRGNRVGGRRGVVAQRLGDEPLLGAVTEDTGIVVTKHARAILEH
mmetsp:Transcript_4122/g.16911  ORF Transcript_4122/g.16911 Transcript_4122/m.16911 type:complete len:218 (-) Transcript_4122:822-1475(-)